MSQQLIYCSLVTIIKKKIFFHNSTIHSCIVNVDIILVQKSATVVAFVEYIHLPTTKDRLIGLYILHKDMCM